MNERDSASFEREIKLELMVKDLEQRLAAAEETNRIAALALSETEAWIKILEKERTG